MGVVSEHWDGALGFIDGGNFRICTVLGKKGFHSPASRNVFGCATRTVSLDFE
jgi:hypothetical protein